MLTGSQAAFLIAFFSPLPSIRRYLKKGPEDQDDDLPGLEEENVQDVNLATLRRRTMAAAAERRMQTQQDPAPWNTHIVFCRREHYFVIIQWGAGTAIWNPLLPFGVATGHPLFKTVIKMQCKPGVRAAQIMWDYYEWLLSHWFQSVCNIKIHVCGSENANLHCPLFVCHTLIPPAGERSRCPPWLGLAVRN